MPNIPNTPIISKTHNIHKNPIYIVYLIPNFHNEPYIPKMTKIPNIAKIPNISNIPNTLNIANIPTTLNTPKGWFQKKS